jgi:hypothetical protein
MPDRCRCASRRASWWPARHPGRASAAPGPSAAHPAHRPYRAVDRDEDRRLAAFVGEKLRGEDPAGGPGRGQTLRGAYDGQFDKTSLPDDLVLRNYFTVRESKIVALVIVFNQDPEY